MKDPAYVVLPDVPLDRAELPPPRSHLRPGPADRAPAPPAGPARRTAHVSPRPADPARRHRRDRLDLLRRTRQAQNLADAHRNQEHDHRKLGQAAAKLPNYLIDKSVTRRAAAQPSAADCRPAAR